MLFTRLRIHLIAFLLVVICLTRAHAQSAWPDTGAHYGTVKVFTLANLGVSQRCRVHAVTRHTIVCGRGFARKPVVYPLDDVATIVGMPDHSGRHFFVGCLSLAIAGTVAAAIFLPPIAAVAIAVPSIYFGLFTAMAMDGDSNDEFVVYQHPNTPLNVHPR